MDIGQGGAAELAGLQIGDRITKIDNKIPGSFQKRQMLAYQAHRSFLVKGWIKRPDYLIPSCR